MHLYLVFKNVVIRFIFYLEQEREVHRFAGTVPNASTTGDIESMAMYAGQSIGLIKEILPAGEVIKRIVEGAQLLIAQQFAPVN